MMGRNLKFAKGFTNQENIVQMGRNFVNAKRDPGKKKWYRIKSNCEAVRYLQTNKKRRSADEEDCDKSMWIWRNQHSIRGNVHC